MAKISLPAGAKEQIAKVFRDRLKYITLSKVAEAVTETPVNPTTNATGLKEVHTIIADTGLAGGGKFLTKNSLAGNPPMLLFTIANQEQPLEYQLFFKSGSDYYRDCIITTTQSKATKDTAFILDDLTINFKGNGEV